MRRSTRATLATAASVLAVALVTVAAAAHASSTINLVRVHVMASHSRTSDHRAASKYPLVDHGGTVLTTSTTYDIWWGPPTNFARDARPAIETLLSGLVASDYLSIADEYMRSSGPNLPIAGRYLRHHNQAVTSYGGAYVDWSTPPSHPLTTTALIDEVGRVLAAAGTSPDPGGIYLVYTSNHPRTRDCAWHAFATIDGVTVPVAYLPNETGVTGCDPGNLFHVNGYTEGTRALADATAHEVLEAITDPNPGAAWLDRTGAEIADKCNFRYASPVTLSNGSTWQLQELWSNKDHGCVQG